MDYQTKKTAPVVILNGDKVYHIGLAEITIETDDILPNKIVTLDQLHLIKKNGVIFSK